jgi:hypothetical protein
MTQIPRADKGRNCPLHREPMEHVCHTCPWWISLRGVNRNTGAEVDEWGCAVAFLPMLLIENAAQTRGAAAATEDARNEIVSAFERVAAMAWRGEGAKLIAPAG